MYHGYLFFSFRPDRKKKGKERIVPKHGIVYVFVYLLKTLKTNKIKFKKTNAQKEQLV